MRELPDAPWIRQAELYGMDEQNDVYCPVCGEENPEEFYIEDNDVVGCTWCWKVKAVDPWDWMAYHPDIGRSVCDE